MRASKFATLLLLAPVVACAQSKLLPPAQQIALAVLPLPNEFRANASVLGYDKAGKLVWLRKSTGVMTCIANDPKEKTFHVACYHNSMEPFMLRGRELRAQGVKDPQVDTVRFAEVKSGKIVMPKSAGLWQLNGPLTAVDPATAKITKAIEPTYVLYLPFATPESSGIPANGVPGAPWLMLPGTPKAHVMFSMSM